MSNAIIKIEGLDDYELDNAAIWKSFHGDPANTLPWLEKFNQDFFQMSGGDPICKFAQCLRSSVLCSEEFDLDASVTTGWGICGDEWDADYIYTLMRDGTVTVTQQLTN